MINGRKITKAEKAAAEGEIVQLILNDPDILFFDDIFCTYLTIGRTTAYKIGLNKLDSIKEALASNKQNKKKKMRRSWTASDNASLQIAAYKLIGSDEERDILNAANLKVKADANVTGSVDITFVEK